MVTRVYECITNDTNWSFSPQILRPTHRTGKKKKKEKKKEKKKKKKKGRSRRKIRFFRWVLMTGIKAHQCKIFFSFFLFKGQKVMKKKKQQPSFETVDRYTGTELKRTETNKIDGFRNLRLLCKCFGALLGMVSQSETLHAEDRINLTSDGIETLVNLFKDSNDIQRHLTMRTDSNGLLMALFAS